MCQPPGKSTRCSTSLTRLIKIQCDPGWFHLECVKLPSLPPSKFGWFCKDCLKACNVDDANSGLICPRGEEGGKLVRDWLLEEKRKKSKNKKKQKLKGRQAKKKLTGQKEKQRSRKSSNSSEGETSE